MAKRKKKRKPKTPKRYDVKMIEDFLEHLRWELVINHFEHTRPDAVVNPDLVDQLTKCVDKRDTIGLMMMLEIETKGVEKNTAKANIKILREAQAKKSQEGINALEILNPIFQEAFICARHPDTLLVKRLPLKKMLEQSKESEDDNG